ncbi:Alpha/beta hydrolase fold-1 [Ephemerocybe angulata]|uniref:Alpha/beta hydrolase fold-1 n=1 Tax=Ephemerocybe angulata TaxID=980116 RepID=A0A8H6HYI2_9AGAR|nr:Alpha/beta hydrolase fold-1 [Tulosesus angulatus]
MAHLRVETLILPPDGTYPLFITANKYQWRSENRPRTKGSGIGRGEYDMNTNGLTLVMLHSSSFHKETWEACLETLFSLADASGVAVREAWAIECPNHGESAVLNTAFFEVPPYSNHFGCEGYSQAVHRFLTRAPVPFHDRQLVGIGHSLGANTILMIQTFRPAFPFSSLILVEPMVSSIGDMALQPLRDRLVEQARKRRDKWTSREEARIALHKKCGGRRWKGVTRGKWDERVINSFVEHGLVPKASEGSQNDRKKTDDRNGDMTSFVLACTKQQEINMYTDDQGSVAPVEVLDQISSKLPIHLILGELKDYIPAHVHAALVGPAPGRNFASISMMPNVGHLVPQEKPDELAVAIIKILQGPGVPQPKL